MKADEKLKLTQDVLRSVETELVRAFGEDRVLEKLFKETQDKWREFANANTALTVYLLEGGSAYSMAHSPARASKRTRRFRT